MHAGTYTMHTDMCTNATTHPTILHILHTLVGMGSAALVAALPSKDS